MFYYTLKKSADIFFMLSSYRVSGTTFDYNNVIFGLFVMLWLPTPWPVWKKIQSLSGSRAIRSIIVGYVNWNNFEELLLDLAQSFPVTFTCIN